RPDRRGAGGGARRRGPRATRSADALCSRAEAPGGAAAKHPPQPSGARAEAPALRARRGPARVARYRSFKSTASISTLAELLSGLAASSGAGAVSTASASTFTVQRKGIFRDMCPSHPADTSRSGAEQGDAMHALRGLRLGLAIVTALAGALLASAAAHATPTAITFTIEHADCAGAGVNSFALYLNDTLLATVPSTQGCTCNASPLVASFTDAATLALFDPAACNSFRVDVTGGGAGVALGIVRASVSTASGPASTCLFD